MAREKKQSSLRKKTVAAVLVGLLLVAALTGVVAAKYVSDNRRAEEIHASGFHFSSDYLEVSGGTLSVSDWDTKGIVFRIYNYEKENVAQISDVDMGYKITVPDGWKIASVKTEQGEWVPPVEGVYTMAASEESCAHVVTLEYAGSGQPGSATVTAAAVSPYAKTLKATFQFPTESAPTFKLEDCGGAVRLTVSSNNFAGNIRVTWPQDKASPDNVNAGVDMSEWQNDHAAAGETFPAEAHHTYTLYFMKKNDAAISKSEFTVKGEN